MEKEILTEHEVIDNISKIVGGHERVSISKKIINEAFSLDNINAKSINFFNVQFNSEVIITGSLSKEVSLTFFSCEFGTSVQVLNIDINDLSFEGCTGRLLLIDNIVIDNNFVFNFNEFAQFHLDNTHLKNCFFTGNKNCKISNVNFKTDKLVIANNSSDFEFVINPKGTNDYSEIKSLHITLETAFGGILKFLKCEITHLELTGISNSNIEFLFCRFKNVEFDQFINGSLMKFSGVEFIRKSKLKITASDLGKTMIFGADFNEIELFNLHSINIK